VLLYPLYWIWRECVTSHIEYKGVILEMFSIDDSKCTGCGICADACPQGAISLQNHTAVIDQNLCIRCGTCLDICPAGAVRMALPVSNRLGKGGESMLGRSWLGTAYPGRGGLGRGMGRGFGMGMGRGNPYPFCRFYPWLPRRWWTYGSGLYPQSTTDRYVPYVPYR